MTLTIKDMQEGAKLLDHMSRDVPESTTHAHGLAAAALMACFTLSRFSPENRTIMYEEFLRLVARIMKYSDQIEEEK